jgi:hypothetical protein
MKPTIHADKVYSFTNYVVVAFYPYTNAIVSFSYNDKSKINKDEFMTGIWKLKTKKN